MYSAILEGLAQCIYERFKTQQQVIETYWNAWQIK